MLGADGRLLATSVAVIAGITYNFLPFMVLPLYVSLEQVDPRLIEAASDLYANRAALVRPRDAAALAARASFAGVLLTFIPAAGDFINAQLLGTPQQYMIGNVIQSQFLELRDYPTAAALSFVLMGAILVLVLDLRARARHRPADGGSGGMTIAWRFVRRHVLDAYALLALLYLFVPISVVVAFSFNNPLGRFNYTWQGFTFKNWTHPFGYPGLSGAIKVSIEIAIFSSIVATILGTLIALALVRYRFRGSGTTEPPDLRADDDARDRDGRVAADALPQLEDPAGLRDDPDRAHPVQHQLRRGDRAGAPRRLRPASRGGGDGPRRQRAGDVLSASRCR